MKARNIVLFLTILLVINTALIIPLSSLGMLVFSHSYYRQEFSKLNVYSDVPDADSVSAELIGFLKGRNEVPDAFNEREKSHLEDVKALVKSAITIYYLLLLLEALLLTALFFKLRNTRRFFNQFKRILFISSCLILSISLLLFILPFDSLFSGFHAVFFKADSWLFSGSDLIVNLFPQRFFYDFFFKAIFNSAAISAVIVVLYLVNKRFLKSRMKKAVRGDSVGKEKG